MSELEVKLQLRLHENQLTIHRHKAKNKAVLAGKRFGKTKWLLFELCKAAAMKVKGTFWYIAPTYGQAEEIAWKALLYGEGGEPPIIPQCIIRKQLDSKLMVELVSGSTLKLKGADNKDSLRGPKLDGIGMDEADYIEKDIFPTILAGQLLGTRGEEPGFAYFISSPKETGATWFPGFVDEAKRRMMLDDKNWAGFNFTIHDNPLLTPEYIGTLKESMPEDKWNLEYMAIPSSLAGQLYSEFTRQGNLGVYEGNRALPVVRGLDWGIDHPTVCLWAKVDVETDTIYVYDELQKTDMVIQELCTRIKDMTGNGPIEATVCDPSLNKRNSQTLRTDMTEFTRWGVPCIPGDNRDRGRDIVKMLLKQGRLKISPKCKNLIYGLEHVQYGEDINDDATDSCRYLCVWVHDRFPGWKRSLEVDDNPRNKKPGQYYMDELFKPKEPSFAWALPEEEENAFSQEF